MCRALPTLRGLQVLLLILSGLFIHSHSYSQCESEVDYDSFFFECNSDGIPSDSFYVDINFTPLVSTGIFTFSDLNGNIPDQTFAIGDIIDFGVPSPSSYTLTQNAVFTYEFGPFMNGDDIDIILETPGGCTIEIVDQI